MPELRIEKLLNNGCGLARRENGQVVMVPGALPGEHHPLENLHKKKGIWWAQSSRCLKVSPQRVIPACPHFEGCGGCSLLHVERSGEMALKVAYLQDTLVRIGKLDRVTIKAVDFPLEESRHRGKFHGDGRGRLGFRQSAKTTVTNIPFCAILPLSVKGLYPSLQTWAADVGFKGSAFFAVGQDGNHPVLELQGTVRDRGQAPEAPPGWMGVIFKLIGQPERRLGDPLIGFRWNRFSVAQEPSWFFQSNPRSWSCFFDRVKDWLSASGLKRVWDAHAGAGFLTSCLQDRLVLASEPHRGSFEQLKQNLDSLGFSDTAFNGTAELALSRFSKPLGELDGVLLDPPREGLSMGFKTWLLGHGPRSLLYFSCDMGTFCRDIKQLAPAYRLADPLWAMNVSPGSLKLETAAVLERLPVS